MVTDEFDDRHPLSVAALNASTAGQSLGIIGFAPGGNTKTLTGTLISIATTILDGGGGADTITGSAGERPDHGRPRRGRRRRLAGTDTLVEQRNADMLLGAATSSSRERPTRSTASSAPSSWAGPA